MSPKERWRATWRFEPLDRPWRFETLGFWKETYREWADQGLPFWVRSDPAAYVYFNYDRWIPVVIGDHLQPGYWPRFRRKRVSSEGDHEIWQNECGGLEKVFAGDRSALPQVIRPPVQTHQDLERILPRLDPDAPGRLRPLRLDSFFDRASIRAAQWLDYPLGMIFCGLFGALRHLLGLERFMTATYDEPELLHRIAEAWERLVVGVGRRMAGYGATWAGFWEDMCYRNGMFISPRSYRELILPYFKRAVAHLADCGIEFTWVDSDGDVTELIPLVREAGIKGMMPFEVQAGMDVVEVREQHPDFVIIGGLDKRLLADGREAMEREIQEKAIPLLRSGGHIPGLDHAVPPNVTLEDFRWFLERMRGEEIAAACG